MRLRILFPLDYVTLYNNTDIFQMSIREHEVEVYLLVWGFISHAIITRSYFMDLWIKKGSSYERGLRIQVCRHKERLKK